MKSPFDDENTNSWGELYARGCIAIIFIAVTGSIIYFVTEFFFISIIALAIIVGIPLLGYVISFVSINISEWFGGDEG